MSKHILATGVIAIAVGMIVPAMVLAHENHAYRIGDKDYQFTVGSMNEPIAVDDKTGVYLKVVTIAEEKGDHEEVAAEDHDSPAGAVEGLDQTLKVEVSAGGKKKEMSLSPIHGEPGGYRATFIPTVQTTYTYRFFGTVNKTPVNLEFTCNAAGHPVAEEDKTEKKMSDEVTRLLKRGAFGCPVAKADIGFPEPAVSEYDLAQNAQVAVGEVRGVATSAGSKGTTGLAFGLLGTILGLVAIVRSKRV